MPAGKIRFSAQIPGASDASAWQDKVRRAEDQGFYSVSVPDHLSPDLPQLAPLVALTAAAAVTSNLRLAITVLNNDFRHPAMLAKEIATLDLLSGGRVDLGIGAGWMNSDYTSSGVRGFDPPGQRVDRLEEALAILPQLLSGEEVTFDGKHYHLDAFTSYPTAVQSRVPIMVGGEGRRMLTLAAHHADIVSIVVNNPKVDSGLKAFEERVEWLSEIKPDDRELTLGLRIVMGIITDPGANAEEAAAPLAARRGVSPREVLESPFVMIGDRSAIKDRITEFAERYGVSYFTVSEDFAWQLGDLVGDLSR